MSPLDFEPICDLGRGGMGTVLLVRLVGPQQFERLFVLKRLREDRKDEETALRFAYEGRVASAIRHANVVHTHHVGQDEQGLFLVLDYVEGASLEELLAALARVGRFAPHPIVLRIVLDALAGLSAVHEARDLAGKPLAVLHRDVTLQNVLIGVDGVSRLADFGIAKTASSPVKTNQSYVLGKLRFLAPEYVRREPVTQSIDVYSLGVSLWHALTGKVLWRMANEAELIEHVMFDSVPPVSTQVTVVAPALDAIVSKACARQPSQRFQSARQMAEALETSGLPIATHGEVGELIRHLFSVELAERRKLIADISSRAAHYQPKLYAENVQLSASPREARRPQTRQSSGQATQSSTRRRRRRRAGWAAALVVLGIGGALAALEVRADARTGPAVAAPAPKPALRAPASVSPPLPATAVSEPSASPPLDPAKSARAPRSSTTGARAPSSLVKKNPYRE